MKRDGNWIGELPLITKQYNNTGSTKLNPIECCSKKIEGYVHQTSLENRMKIKANYKIGDLFATADSKWTFWIGDTTSWSYKLFEVTEIVRDTIPSYKTDQLPERYNEALLKKTNLSMKENDSVMEK